MAPEAQFIYLSATVANPEGYAKKLEPGLSVTSTDLSLLTGISILPGKREGKANFSASERRVFDAFF